MRTGESNNRIRRAATWQVIVKVAGFLLPITLHRKRVGIGVGLIRGGRREEEKGS